MEKKQNQKDWVNILFLTLTPFAGVIGTGIYVFYCGIRWWEPLLFLISYLAIGLSVTAGYHRYYSHRSYECHPVVQGFFLFFGAMALQNSLLHWASDHRDHHRYVDTERDPYNIKRGGWWAHMQWIFYKVPADRPFDNAPDLRKNKLVMLQHRYSIWIGIVAGLGLPTLIGAFFGRPLGGLLWGGLLRVVVVHHSTFFINSLAHLFGTRPYSDAYTARDNWLLALLTYGEGYHNFHHKFPGDYRNGIRWFQWDPTKWLIRVLQSTGLAKEVRQTPQAIIDRARLGMTTLKAEARLRYASPEIEQAVRKRLIEAQQSLDRAIELWADVQLRAREFQALGRNNAAALKQGFKAKLREYEACLAHARREWRHIARMLREMPEAV